MGLLFRAAFRNHSHRMLIFVTVIAMCLMTFASQLEMFALGVITRKGPDFFELFAPIEEGQLVRSDRVTKDRLIERFDQIAPEGSGVITKQETQAFLSEWKGGDMINAVVEKVSRIFPITENMRNLAIFLILVAFFKAMTLFAHRFSTKVVAIRVSCDLRQDFFEHMQKLPMGFFRQYNSGTLSSRAIGDASLISEAINACLVNYMQTPFTILSTLVICFLTSWQLSLMVFLGFPLIVLPITFLSRRVKKISKQIQRNQEHFTSVLLDFLSGILTVKAFRMENFSLKKYREYNYQMARLEQKSARYDLSSRPVVHTIGMVFLAIALLYGLYVIQMSISEVFFFCGLLYLLYEPIKKFAEENTRIQRGVAAAERMYEIMHLAPEQQDTPGSIPIETFDREIVFENVWFRYLDDWVLKDVSFSIKKGETVAIVGATGAGKSTIVQLLPRLYQCQKGQIRIDGTPIDALSQSSLRELIAYVPQKPFLFLDTVSANIAFGRDYSDEEIASAAAKAHAAEFIEELPEKYQTLVAEGGNNLSGGQQQRIAIARALVKDSPILVMDEATSSLDNVSEHKIKQAIRELHGKVTQIIIAHRLTTIEGADRILFMERGRIIAQGTKHELLKSCDGFRHMWELLSMEEGELQPC